VSTDPNRPTGSSNKPATSISEALLTRQSARAFLPTPVPLATVTELLDLARWAPSGSNIQPWRAHALAGAPLQAVVDETLAMAMAGQSPEQEYLYYSSPLPEPYLSRRRANGWGLYGHLGIGKGDRAASAKQSLRNFAFFGAPVALFFFIDAGLEKGSWVDYGMFLQSFMLAARERGLHTCPQAAWLPYHELARRHCGLDQQWTLVCGMALGYLDAAEHVNAFRTPRLPAIDFLSASGFQETT
jgi:nitroreductase